MLSRIVQWFRNLFSRQSFDTFELVETKVSDDAFRQGVRILGPSKFNGIIATFSPKVSLSIVDEMLSVKFDYRVEKNPNNIELIDSELRPILGGIAIELIEKDVNAFRITDS